MAGGSRRGAQPSFQSIAVDSGVRARAMGTLYVAGATIGAVSLLLPHAAKADELALWSNVALAYLGGLLLFTIGPRLPQWAFHVGLATGSVLVTRAVLDSGDPVSFYSVWFIWIGIYAFYFFSRLQAAGHVALVAALYAVTLIAHPASSPVSRWLTTVTTLIVAGVFIDTLVRGARRQAALAAQSATSIATVAQAAHDLARVSDSVAARRALCTAAGGLTAADTATLWEPAPAGATLELTGSWGPPPSQSSLPFVSAPGGAVRAFTTGQVVSGSADEGLPEFAGASRPPRCCLWRPVLRDSVPIAVLALYWADPHALEHDNRPTIADLIATEAAVTLERVELLSRLESIARTDDLTGLPNRRAWEEELPREVLRSRRDRRPLCVAMVDLDHFKRYNDERGHPAGDRLLKQAAAAWNDALRGTDILARYGGEEFALALPSCPPDEAMVVVERLRAATPEGETCSAGIASWDGDESAGSLLARADAALYEAKRRGRDRSVAV
ncbi:MAG: GGDEF domain-containing protein [Thermoleophilaceae bacterium]